MEAEQEDRKYLSYWSKILAPKLPLFVCHAQTISCCWSIYFKNRHFGVRACSNSCITCQDAAKIAAKQGNFKRNCIIEFLRIRLVHDFMTKRVASTLAQRMQSSWFKYTRDNISQILVNACDMPKFMTFSYWAEELHQILMETFNHYCKIWLSGTSDTLSAQKDQSMWNFTRFHNFLEKMLVLSDF